MLWCGLAGRPPMPYHYQSLCVRGGHFQISTATYEEILGLVERVKRDFSYQLRFT